MPTMQVKRSIIIDVPVKPVFQQLNHFKRWPLWSPWLICEPDAQVIIAQDGQYYEWHGQRIGEGSMRIVQVVANSRIEYELCFHKPWKAKYFVSFDLEPREQTTEVTWTMHGRLPWLMFWMKKMMQALIGSDFERGLLLLKNVVQTGRVDSKLSLLGRSVYPGCEYLGIERKTTKEQLALDMQQDFVQLNRYLKDHHLTPSLTCFSIYRRWDIVSGAVHYTIGAPLHCLPDSCPQGMVTGRIPAGTLVSVRHQGPYCHLGNAWAMLYKMLHNKEFVPIKQIHPFETYVNSPYDVTDETALVTDIHFAIRA